MVPSTIDSEKKRHVRVTSCHVQQLCKQKIIGAATDDMGKKILSTSTFKIWRLMDKMGETLCVHRKRANGGKRCLALDTLKGT